jgi:chemotaxis protein MotB
MKPLLVIPVLICTLLFSASCGKHLRCEANGSTKKPKGISSKKYKASLAERDSLCAVSQSRATEIEKLNGSVSSLRSEIQELTNQYEDLKKTSGLTQASLNETLRKKELELQKKETALQEKEKRLRELEGILKRQDSILSALHNTIKNALLGFNSDELSIKMKEGKIYVSMSDKLLFKSGKADVEPRGKEALKQLSDALNKNPEIQVLIEGHTDNVPIKTSVYRDNWDLSSARAISVVRILSEENKVKAERITASGKAEFSPVATNDTPEGRAKNRRTEIILVPNLTELFNVIMK